MPPQTFDDALRLQSLVSGSRRAALGALVGAVLAAALPGESAARRSRGRQRLGRKRRDRDGRRKHRHRDRDRNHRGKRDDPKNKHRNKNKRRKKDRKGRKGKSKGCNDKHSEKDILGFIHKAAKKYNQSEHAMVRVARCESALDPCAFNRSGPYYGLFQFLKSTWKDTPYGNKNIYDPKAQAFAAAWMWKQGRKNEWACK